ncbi:hypothetical protein C3F09_12250 [candidate division GN15 bacterium]|uniref:Glycosyltransferase 2-like domain-containing protein n=1 Tax=candidate division GN15 bacterium TaxID=2072418 RepID=A0A855X3A5_9BACT|nr:MAG: hypothetical protein C3F09_12250 [candidate division GN15 bacterium]
MGSRKPNRSRSGQPGGSTKPVGAKSRLSCFDSQYAACRDRLAKREFKEALALADDCLTAITSAPVSGGPSDTLIARLHYIAGESLVGAGKVEDAIGRFQTAIDANPVDQLPYLSLSRCQVKTGNVEAAHHTLSRGIAACAEKAELKMLSSWYQTRPSISACMIVKDEEELLPECLDSIRDWVDEIIVVDTGSGDRTVEIAKSFGAQVYHHAWEGDFSKSRNYSLQYATKEWILIIDADERIAVEDVPEIRRVLSDPQQTVVSVNVLNKYEHNRNLTVFLPSVRFFKRELGLRYGGIVHNQLVVPADARVRRTGIRLIHLGYGLSADKMAQKKARSLDLLKKQLAANPDDPFALFNYAQLLRSDSDGFSAENIPAIIESASRAVELTRPDDPSTRHIHLMCLDQLAWAHFFSNKLDAAIQYCNRALAGKPDYLDPMLLLGHIYTQQQDFPAAVRAYQRYLTARENYDPSREADNIILLHLDSQSIAWYSMAMGSELVHDCAVAKEYYRRVLALDSNYLAANERLGRILFAEGAYAEAREHLERQLESSGPTAALHNDLGNCLFKSGDEDSARRHYEEALVLDPDFGPAQRNLGLALARANRPEQAAELLSRYLNNHHEPALVEILADLHLSNGSYQSAVSLYETHLRSHPEDGSAIYRLSECYLAMGHRDAALVGMRRALELSPDKRTVLARIQELEGHSETRLEAGKR